MANSEQRFFKCKAADQGNESFTVFDEVIKEMSDTMSWGNKVQVQEKWIFFVRDEGDLLGFRSFGDVFRESCCPWGTSAPGVHVQA